MYAKNEKIISINEIRKKYCKKCGTLLDNGKCNRCGHEIAVKRTKKAKLISIPQNCENCKTSLNMLGSERVGMLCRECYEKLPRPKNDVTLIIEENTKKQKLCWDQAMKEIEPGSDGKRNMKSVMKRTFQLMQEETNDE